MRTIASVLWSGDRLRTSMLFGIGLWALAAGLPAQAAAEEELIRVPSFEVSRFFYTGAQQTFVVPAGVTQMTVTATGAGGGTVRYKSGGWGATAEASVAVTPGQTLYVEVGGAGSNGAGYDGGFNGGGQAPSTHEGGVGPELGNGGAGGGGASDVQTVSGVLASAPLSSVLVVGGGGGGAGAFGHGEGEQGGGGGGGNAGQPGGAGEPALEGAEGEGSAGGGGAAGEGASASGGKGAYYLFGEELRNKGEEPPSGIALYGWGYWGGASASGSGGLGGETSYWPEGPPGEPAKAWPGGGGGGGGGLIGGGGGGGGAALCKIGTPDHCTITVESFAPTPAAGEAGGGGGGGGSSYAPGGTIRSGGNSSSVAGLPGVAGEVELAYTTYSTHDVEVSTPSTGAASAEGKAGEPSNGEEEPIGGNYEVPKLKVPLSCKGATDTTCKLTVELSVLETLRGGKLVALAASGKSHKKTTHRTVVIASDTLTLAAGHNETVKLALNTAGKALLRNHHLLKAELTVTQAATAGKGKTIKAKRLTLKATKRSRAHGKAK